MDADDFRIAVQRFSVPQLLAGYGVILDELKRREIVRSANSPLSDYAELLFCKAFGWARENNSVAGHDTTDATGLRYQVKGRRITPGNASRQMSAIRKLDEGPFDFLAGVLVDENFLVLKAAIIPIAVIRAKSSHVAHTNSWRFLLRDDIWAIAGVRDVTEVIQNAASSI